MIKLKNLGNLNQTSIKNLYLHLKYINVNLMIVLIEILVLLKRSLEVLKISMEIIAILQGITSRTRTKIKVRIIFYQ
jgi:hypothetical protein